MKRKIIITLMISACFITGCSFNKKEQTNNDNFINVKYVNGKIPNEALDYPTYFKSNIDAILGEGNWEVIEKEVDTVWGDCKNQLNLTVKPINNQYTEWTFSYKLPSGETVKLITSNYSIVDYICSGDLDDYSKTTVEQDMVDILHAFGSDIAENKLVSDLKKDYDFDVSGYDISASTLGSPLLSDEEKMTYKLADLKSDWFNINDITMDKILKEAKCEQVLFFHMNLRRNDSTTLEVEEKFKNVSNIYKDYLINKFGTFYFENRILSSIGSIEIDDSEDYYNGEVVDFNLLNTLYNDNYQ